MGDSLKDIIEVLYDDNGIPINYKVRGRQIYSSVSAARQVETWYEKEVKNIKEDILVVFGFGLGIHLKRLLEEKSEERMIYLIVEDKETFATLHPYSGLNFKLLNGIYTMEEVSRFLSTLPGSMGALAKKGIRVTGFPPLVKALEAEYTKFLKDLNDILRMMKVNYNTSTFLGPQMEINEAVNIVRTLKYPGIKEWQGVLGDFPVVVVGAGPSLVKNIDVLKENQHRVFIIAVGRVVKLLAEKGIRPDAVCIIDPNVLQYEYISGVDLSDIFIVADHKSSYLVFEKVQARFVAFDRSDPLTKWLRSFTGDKGYLSDFFNVSHMGVLLSYFITKGPIALMGVDLAYANTTHANGVVLNKTVDMSKMPNAMWVEGNVEEKVATMPNMYSMIRFLEAAIGGNRPIFNATEGGARIRGAEPTTLKEFIYLYGLEEKKNFVDGMLDKYRLSEFSVDECKKIRDHFKELLDNLLEIQKKYQEGTAKVEKLKKYSSNIRKHVDKINKTLTQIDVLHESLYEEIKEKKAEIIISFNTQAEILLRTRRDHTLRYREQNDFQKVLEEEIKRFGSYFDSMVFNVEYAAQIVLNMLAILDEEYACGVQDAGNNGDGAISCAQNLN